MTLCSSTPSSCEIDSSLVSNKFTEGTKGVSSSLLAPIRGRIFRGGATRGERGSFSPIKESVGRILTSVGCEIVSEDFDFVMSPFLEEAAAVFLSPLFLRLRDERSFPPIFPLLEEGLEVLEDFEDGVLEAAMSEVRIDVYQERRSISLKEHT